jgi:hypothetical protein
MYVGLSRLTKPLRLSRPSAVRVRQESLTYQQIISSPVTPVASTHGPAGVS